MGASPAIHPTSTWLPLPLFPLAEYPDPARSQGLSNGLSTWQVGFRWPPVGWKSTKLGAPKVEPKQGQVDHICSSLPTPKCPSFPFISHIFYHFLSNQFIQDHTSNLQKVKQTQNLKPLTGVTYACWYTCPSKMFKVQPFWMQKHLVLAACWVLVAGCCRRWVVG